MTGFFDVRNQIHVLHHCHDEHLLVRVASPIRMRKNIKKPSRLNRQNNIFKRDPTRLLEPLVFLLVPPICLHAERITECVPFVIKASLSLE